MLDATIEAHNIWDDQTAVSFWEQLKDNKKRILFEAGEGIFISH